MNGKLEYEYLPFFHDKVTGKESYILADLLRAIKCPEDITVDTNTKSGFAEIDVRQPDFKHYYPITEESLETRVPKMIAAMKRDLELQHSPKEKYAFHCSGGADSRILLMILKQLQDEKGIYIDNLYILTHEPEIDVVERVIKEHHIRGHFLPWRRPYQLIEHTNGFIGFQLKYWDIKSQDYILLAGTGGGEQLSYPADQVVKGTGMGRRKNTIGGLWMFDFTPPTQMCKESILWKDVIYPFLNWDFLALAMSIPPRDFYYIEGTLTDVIRTTMLKVMGDEIPTYRGHTYKFTFDDPDIVEKVGKKYRASAFYAAFSPYDRFVAGAKPETTILDKLAVDSKLYGLAMTYEDAVIPNGFARLTKRIDDEVNLPKETKWNQEKLKNHRLAEYYRTHNYKGELLKSK